MYTLVRLLSTRSLLTKQLPSFATAFLVAELFYKFHSFSLECLAFLATWFLIDALVSFFESITKRHAVDNSV